MKRFDKSGPVQLANIAFSMMMFSLAMVFYDGTTDPAILEARLFSGWALVVWPCCALFSAVHFAKATVSMFYVAKAGVLRSARRLYAEDLIGQQTKDVQLERPVHGKWLARVEMVFNVAIKAIMKGFAVPFAALGWLCLASGAPLLGTIMLIHSLPAIAIATCHSIMTLPDTLTHKLVLKSIRAIHRFLTATGEMLASILLGFLKT